MVSFLDSVVEYRTLLARRDAGRIPLPERARQRLDSLRHALEYPVASLVGPSYHGTRRRYARLAVDLPAVADLGETEVPVDIVSVGGGGLALRRAPNVSTGDLIVVKLNDNEGRHAYQLPTRAVWSVTTAGDRRCGLQFVDVPVRRAIRPRPGQGRGNVAVRQRVQTPAASLALATMLRAGDFAIDGMLDSARIRRVKTGRPAIGQGAHRESSQCSVRLQFTSRVGLELDESCSLALPDGGVVGPLRVVDRHRTQQGERFTLTLRAETTEAEVQDLTSTLRRWSRLLAGTSTRAQA